MYLFNVFRTTVLSIAISEDLVGFAKMPVGRTSFLRYLEKIGAD